MDVVQAKAQGGWGGGARDPEIRGLGEASWLERGKPEKNIP
jgi:hypothetical protein